SAKSLARHSDQPGEGVSRLSTMTFVVSGPMKTPDLTVVPQRRSAYVRLGAVAEGPRSASYGSYDDLVLGDLIGRRDPAALEELYDRHGGAVYGLARRVVADEQLAHDVVQEVFLAIW